MCLVGHFRDKLDAYQANFLLAVVVAKLVKSSIKVVCFAFFEVLIDVVYQILVKHFIDKVVNVYFGARVYNGFNFVEQLVKFNAIGHGYVV